MAVESSDFGHNVFHRKCKIGGGVFFSGGRNEANNKMEPL